MKIATSRQFRQQLYRGHVFLGILLSLFMYTSVFFGIFAIFMPYLNTWEKPSRHFRQADIPDIDYESMLEQVLSDPDFPRDRIFISLPGYKKDPALRISHLFTRETVFNPNTGQQIQDEGPATHLAMFLNGMHYARPLKKTGLVLFGLMTPGVMFLIGGGLFLIALFTYKNKGRSAQTVYSKWHRRLFLWTFLPFLLVVLCGSVMGISFDGTGPMTYVLTRGKTANIRPVIGPVLFPEPAPVKVLNQPVPMNKLTALIEKARQVNPQIRFQRLILENWGDKSAVIRLEGYNPFRPFLNGVTNKPAVALKGADGSLISQNRVEDRPWGVLLTEAVYFLHLLFGVGIVTRLLVAGGMLGTGTALGFGIMLYLKKRAGRFKGRLPFYHWMDKLSLAVAVGVIPATGLFLNLQWILPFDMAFRLTWQQGLFFNAWLGSLAWSFYRVSTLQAAKEFLITGGLLFLLAPLLHFVRTGTGPMGMIQDRMLNIFCVDLGFALAGMVFLVLAWKLPNAGAAETGGLTRGFKEVL